MGVWRYAWIFPFPLLAFFSFLESPGGVRFVRWSASFFFFYGECILFLFPSSASLILAADGDGDGDGDRGRGCGGGSRPVAMMEGNIREL